MALAAYYSKNTLALKQVLNSSDTEGFEKVLNSHVVEIAFDETVKTFEGSRTVDLLIRLICRLYPKIKLTDLSSICESERKQFLVLASEINQNIEITDDKSTVIVVVGVTVPETGNKAVVFFAGSDGWEVKHSTQTPVGSGVTKIPFAAGIAACISASNVFRCVFRDFLSEPKYDTNLNYELLSKKAIRSNKYKNAIKVILDNPTLIGLGAIGNGSLWILQNLPDATGKVTIIDDEVLSLSNLQRYVMSLEKHQGRPKMAMIEKNGSIKIIPKQANWYEYSTKKKIKEALVAVDSGLTRIHIQSSLPERIFNAYTGDRVLGITSHTNFGVEACLACDYVPTDKKKDRSVEVAENLGIPEHEFKVRLLLYKNQPISEEILAAVAKANNFDYSELQRFEGCTLEAFYSDFICGGIVLSKNNKGVVHRVDAPLAFQSCMAGILMLLEYLTHTKKPKEERSKNFLKINSLAPFNEPHNPYRSILAKNGTGTCICGDPIYLRAKANRDKVH